MSLNIKSDEAYALTRELSRLTGESLTQAVTAAVRERLERVRAEPDQTRARSPAANHHRHSPHDEGPRCDSRAAPRTS